MIHQPQPESVVEELHRIRREISDRFGGDVAAIAKDAAERLARSGRRVWKPHAETKVSRPTNETGRSAEPAATVDP